MREGLPLVCSMKPLAARNHQKDAPFLGKIQTRDQGSDLRVWPFATIHQKTTLLESMKAQSGPGAATDPAGQFPSMEISQAMYFCQSSGYGQTQLGTSSQADVLRGTAFDA